MSDHEFEKQVRQKLGDLKLTPAPQAWEKIENNLRERKRRRVPLIWLPLLLLGLGAGGYFIFKPGSDQAILLEENRTASDKIISENKTTERETAKIVSDEIADKNAIDKTGDEKIITGNIENKNVLNRKENNINENSITGAVTRKSRISVGISSETDNGEDSKAKNKIIAGNDLEKKPVEAIIETNTENISREKEQKTKNAEEQFLTPKTEDVAAEKKSAIQLNPAEKAAEPAKAVENKRKQKTKKWSFGVTAFAGVSAVNEGSLVNFSSPQVEDVALVPNFAAPAVLPNNPPPPSKIYPGFSYSAGVFAKRELSGRLSVSAGINYLQLNTFSKVGDKINSNQIVNNGNRRYLNVSTYYLPDDNYSSEYRNRYHLIEVPVNLHMRINKSDRLPIYWNAGIAGSYLINSNSLHYDGMTGVYYKDDNLLNKLQGTVTTGFSFSVFNKSERPLWIGPAVRYNLSAILKKDVNHSSKNFMGLGLDLKWHLR